MDFVVFEGQFLVVKVGEVLLGLELLLKVDNLVLLVFEELLGFDESLFGFELLFEGEEVLLGFI